MDHDLTLIQSNIQSYLDDEKKAAREKCIQYKGDLEDILTAYIFYNREELELKDEASMAIDGVDVMIERDDVNEYRKGLNTISGSLELIDYEKSLLVLLTPEEHKLRIKREDEQREKDRTERKERDKREKEQREQRDKELRIKSKKKKLKNMERKKVMRL
ncbi:hypothetical protein ES708_13593 [subsurface metagenome]